LIKFEDFLSEYFKDKEFEKEFYKGLEKVRIATEVAYHREKRGLSQKQLAELSGVSEKVIAKIENTNCKFYSIKALRKIAEALDLEFVISLRNKKNNRREECLN